MTGRIASFGPLTSRTLSRRLKRLCWIYQEQKARCNKPTHPRYRTYGAKGIRVEYTSKEFIAWYLSAYKKAGISRPHVGRKDHSKNYCFANIELQTASENTKELHARYGGNVNKKLSRQTVQEIRARMLADSSRGVLTRLAREYSVSVATMSYIRSNATWQ